MMKYNHVYIWTISLIAAMGGLLFGYDWVVIGGAKPFYETYFNLTSVALQGWIISSALLGCLAGAALSGFSSDMFGRKKLLILAGFIFTASSIGNGLANDINTFTVCRILGGIAIGLASTISPVYIAELAPAEIRGRMVAINQLTIVIGVLLAQIVNWLITISHPLPDDAGWDIIRESWNGQIGWRWMFAATAVPAFLFFVLSFFVPESPRWLLKKNRTGKASGILERIGGKEYALFEIDDILDSLKDEISKFRRAELLNLKVIKLLSLGIFLAVFQQWCGINTIFYYAEDIFRTAGYNIKGVMLNIVITGSVMLIFTFVAISTVDKYGRKILLLLGTAGLIMSYFLIGLAFHLEKTGLFVLVLTVTAIAFYSFSLAPVVWVLLAEIFPNRIRGVAMSIATSALWIGCFTLTISFPSLNVGLGTAKTFWLYGLICLIGWIVIKIFVRETKGKTLEDIERKLD